MSPTCSPGLISVKQKAAWGCLETLAARASFVQRGASRNAPLPANPGICVRVVRVRRKHRALRGTRLVPWRLV